MHRKIIVRATVLFGLVLFGALFLSVIMPPTREAGLVRVAPQVALAHCDSGDLEELDDDSATACLVPPSGATYLDQYMWFLQSPPPQPDIYDLDWFYFLMEAGDTVVVNVVDVSPPTYSGSDFNLHLYNSALVEVDRDDSSSVGATISYLSTLTDTYYLRVSNVGTTVHGVYPPGCNPCIWPATDWRYDLTINFTPGIPEDNYDKQPGGNDDKLSAKSIDPVPRSLTNLTISPQDDPDYYRFFGNAGQILTFEAFSSYGVTLMLELWDPSDTSIAANSPPYSVTPSLTSVTLPMTGYYIIAVTPQVTGTAYYRLVITDVTPSTATPTPTGTIAPTSTGVPTPTLTPTPDMGNPPDIAEPNNDFYNSFRIAPGNSINLNFNSGIFGVEDVDFFAMTVKEGVTYTCETSDLGIGTDTILIIYGPSTSFDNQLGYNDDIDSLKGNVASRVTWKSEYNGQAYIVVRQNGPLAVPGLATYTLTCYTGQPKTSLPSGGGGGGGAPAAPGPKSAIKIEIVDVPTRVPVPTAAPPGTLTVKLVIAYDENANGIIDLSEGVMGMSVRAISPSTNRQLASGFTDQYGSLQLIVMAPENSEVLVVVPFLSIGKMFRVGQVAEWQVRLPAANLPGLIP